jgi:hypothetical protein
VSSKEDGSKAVSELIRTLKHSPLHFTKKHNDTSDSFQRYFNLDAFSEYSVRSQSSGI